MKNKIRAAAAIPYSDDRQSAVMTVRPRKQDTAQRQPRKYSSLGHGHGTNASRKPTAGERQLKFNFNPGSGHCITPSRPESDSVT
jgi:hypothetical protein